MKKTVDCYLLDAIFIALPLLTLLAGSDCQAQPAETPGLVPAPVVAVSRVLDERFVGLVSVLAQDPPEVDKKGRVILSQLTAQRLEELLDIWPLARKQVLDLEKADRQARKQEAQLGELQRTHDQTLRACVDLSNTWQRSAMRCLEERDAWWRDSSPWMAVGIGTVLGAVGGAVVAGELKQCVTGQ